MFSDKNSLSIRLTEPVVALRDTRHPDGEVPPPGIVRGLLTLTLTKPTKVSSIEVELQAKATTRYSQGAGPSRTDVIEQYKIHSASTAMFKAGPVPQAWQRATSARPRVQFLGGRDAQHSPPSVRPGSGHRKALSGPRSVSLDPRFPKFRRRLSSDDLDVNHGGNPEGEQISNDAAPPYPSSAGQQSLLGAGSCPSVTGRSQSIASSSRVTDPQSSPILPQSSLTPDIQCSSPARSVHSIRDSALSRTPSIEEVPEDNDDSFETSAPRPDHVGYYGLSRVTTGSSGRGSVQDHRGRSHSRFSFGKVVHIFDSVKHHVGSRSPSAGSLPRSDEQEERGRSLMKGKGTAQVGAYGVRHTSQVGAAEPSVADDVNERIGDGWLLFPEGTYTYPIFFTVPNDLPPTMKADHGSLIWKVKAEVKRPSAFVPKMTAQKEVVVVCLPKESDSEGAGGLDLQQRWDNQFQYRVQIPGRSFPVGGKIPFQLTITPLEKIKVHRILVYLDERMEFYTRSETQARSDAIRRATLLVVRHNNSDEMHGTPILPLKSDEAGAFRKSPLYRFLRPGADESEVASSFMGQGPWTIHHELRVPDSCSILHPSNRTKGSNVMVSHTLKIVLRMEKGEEVVTNGRKKLYDIVIHVPIQILSCHCTPEWTSLPRYDEAMQGEGDSPEDASTCPCRIREAKAHSRRVDAQPALLRRAASPSTVDSDTLGALATSDSAASRNYLHELLMSGLVSERGEAAPSYEAIDS